MDSHGGLISAHCMEAGAESRELRLALEAQVHGLQQLVAELVLSNERLRQALQAAGDPVDSQPDTRTGSISRMAARRSGRTDS